MARRSEIVSQCERLMDKPDKIRNIAIAAHIDHGKCVTGDTRIACGDGSIVRAEDLFDRVKSSGSEIGDRDGEAFEPADEIDLVSLDRGVGETTLAPLLYATKRDADEPVIEVTAHNGQVIRTTPEHRFLTLRPDGRFDFVEAAELTEGDVVTASRNVPATPNNEREHLLRSLAGEYRFIVDLTDGFAEQLQKLPRDDLAEVAETNLQRSSFDHAVLRGQLRLRDAVNVCDHFDIPLADLYEGIESLNVRGTDHRGEHSSLEMSLPDDLSNLYYLAGVFFGDGDLEGTITAGDEDMHARIEEAADALDLDVTVRTFDDRTPRCEVGGQTLTTVLQQAFGYPTANKSASIRIGDVVFASSTDTIAAFIRGYFDADGTIEQGRSAVSVSSVSTGMLEDLQLLLYRFDVASKLNRSNSTLYISGALSLENFAEIGFGLSRKQDRFAALLDSAAASKLDSVPIDGSVLREIREDVRASAAAIDPSLDSYERNEVGLSKRSLQTFTERLANESDEHHVQLARLQALAVADTSFVEVTDVSVDSDPTHVYDFGVDDHRNFVANGFIVHNTTLTDNLLAGAGMISADLAGEQLAMDTEEDEQERGITIDAANVSMTHTYDDEEFLVNLIDTPGHVDFGGDVTRAMRAVDGALVVVDAVEGTMPQTETVLRQALREDVKPTLFINKVDRLINELREGPQEMQERLQSVIREVNEIIRGIAEERYEEDDWKVRVNDGSVAFGSALYNWAISMPFMEKTGITFSDIYDFHEEDNVDELREHAPLSEVVLDMVVDHFPNPVDAQPFRIPTIWRGDDQSEIAESMRMVDAEGELVFMVTDIGIDEHAGEIAVGRVFSGTIERGQDLHISGVAGTNRVQSVGIYMGGEREEVERVPAGNIAAVTGLNDAIAGSTVSSVEMTAFESLEHISEPVITKSVEARHMDDLPKLIETLQQVSKEDPTIHVEINEDTGEHLISGQGELHLEVITQRIERNQGIPVRTGEPIVVFREAVQETSDEVEGISPNRHNRFYIIVEPLSDDIVETIKLGDLSMDMPEADRREVLQEAGFDKDDSQNVETIIGPNIVLDDTKGIQHLNETMELVLEGMEDAIGEGPLAGEPVQGALIRLVDARLHEDAIHRGPAQVIPAVRQAVHRAMIDARVSLLEPIQNVRIDVPSEHMGAASNEIQGRRGRVDDMYQEGDLMVIEGIAPVDEMIGFSSDIRSATEGRASWNTENAGFQLMADNLQEETIMEIRERKGMKLELPAGVDYF